MPPQNDVIVNLIQSLGLPTMLLIAIGWWLGPKIDKYLEKQSNVLDHIKDKVNAHYDADDSQHQLLKKMQEANNAALHDLIRVMVLFVKQTHPEETLERAEKKIKGLDI